ncbi:tRNA(Met) cytidine acetyltransferase TmcA [Halocatena halophila]|uniref:tRNA(Met) cytidine acetyltransferase TmcA n=1 Tax=Halocatena halophila TaxID=2814576 RepID=UPI002ED5EE5A
MFEGAIRAVHEEACRANERRLLVVTGPRARGITVAKTVCSVAEPETVVTVGSIDLPDVRSVPHSDTDSLLGTTQDCLLVDCHESSQPNTLGGTIGAVDGGGLVVWLTPTLSRWPERRDEFDATLAVPPATIDDVTGAFRTRLGSLLELHDGIAILDVSTETVLRDGLTDPPPSTARPQPQPPQSHDFPAAAYESCLTTDQARTLFALERLQTPGTATVLESDRGRGKSSVAGLAAGSLAVEGARVLITAPATSNVRALFKRASELVADCGVRQTATEISVETTTGGTVKYVSPTDGIDQIESADACIVDEAAALPVGTLEQFCTETPVAFATTVHGYEGTGRGFAVRFQDRLTESNLDVTHRTMQTPIRYADDDPIEKFAFHALLLDATPPVEPLIEDVTPDECVYERLTTAELIDDDHRLRSLFGLLVLAHYRTEPDDLARLLDAPNLDVRVLTADGHVVAVALLAREGAIGEQRRRATYRGERLRGNMIPDLLTSQLRDPDGATPVGYRVMRIATHPAIQSRGIGSKLLTKLHAEFDEAGWFGVSFGATPELLRFWTANGYKMVHLSTTRNDTSGEHSAVMLRPGASALFEKHTRWFEERIGGMCCDTLSAVSPDLLRGVYAATERPIERSLSDREWQLITSCAYGPGQFDMQPRPFRRLVERALSDPECTSLTPDQERLLVSRVLQAISWEVVATKLGYHSASGCRRALGRALRVLVDRYGTEAAATERRWYDE